MAQNRLKLTHQIPYFVIFERTVSNDNSNNDHGRTWVREERRKNPDRRHSSDRRENIRFEPGKGNRRKEERRKDRRSPWDDPHR